MKKIQLEELFSEWIVQKKLCVKNSTIDKYSYIWEIYLKPVLSDKYTSDYLNADFQTSINLLLHDKYLTKSVSINKSIENVYNQLLKYISHKYGISMQYLHFNNAHKIVIHNKIFDNHEIKTLSNHLISNINTMNLGILICIFMGIRLGEVCALKWSDINLETHTLHIQRTIIRQKNTSIVPITKTCLVESIPKSLCSDRYIPIPNIIFKQIHNFYRPSGYILNYEKYTDPRTLQKRFSSLLKVLHIKHHNFHALRHTFATNCIENNMDVKTLSELLGHSDVKITMNRYVHPTLHMKKTQLEIASGNLFDQNIANL